VVGVYGPIVEEVIQEKFGDGIMSAIDFSNESRKRRRTRKAIVSF